MESGSGGTIGGGERSAGTRVLLSIDHALLSTVSFGEDLFEVLVSSLWRTPVGIAEGLGDFVHVEGIEQRRMRLLVRGGGDGRHD